MAEDQIQVKPYDEGTRLDIYLARILSQKFSRSQVQKLIRDGHIQVDERAVSPHYRIKTGETIAVHSRFPQPEETRGEDIPLNILHEDKDIIVVDKPAGMVVHPAHGNPNHTLVNALLFHFKDLAQMGDPVRPGIVHRLDKDTSGVMIVAKHSRAHTLLAKQFKDHTIERAYRVVVQGTVQHDEGIIEEPVGRAFLNRKKVMVKPSGGKDAVSYFKVLTRFPKASLLEVRPQTGRTHQIRVHMAHLGHPVLGDSLYGIKTPLIDRQALHAYSLGITHPGTGERCSWTSPLPKDMTDLIDQLN